MNLKQKWDTKLATQGRARHNIFDPTLREDNSHLIAFGLPKDYEPIMKERKLPDKLEQRESKLPRHIKNMLAQLDESSKQELLNELL